MAEGARYEVALLRSAEKELAALPRDVQRRVVKRLSGLAIAPRPAGARAMTGSAGAYRLRIGDYRVVYRVLDEERMVRVGPIGHRRDVYRQR